MPALQELIHKIEEGPWFRHLKIVLGVLALVGLVVGYNWRSFKNFNSQEAMDSAQLARNISEGKGYTTLFVRPLSMHLLKKHAAGKPGGVADSDDPTRIKGNHPDLANPPVYPCLLAAVLKVAPMHWNINVTKSFWSQGGVFWRYQPDFVIALFNEVILFAVIVLSFFLARKLFDPGVAWLTAILMVGSELLWRFSVSGLSTLLLMLIFVGLTWCIVLMEQEAREPKGGSGRVLLLAAVTGLVLGLGMLTRYSFGWLLVPVVVFYLLFVGPRKALVCLLTVSVFLLVVTPWIYRNLKLSGLPFGTATVAILEATPMYPEYQLQRSLVPDFSNIFVTGFLPKLFVNVRHILQGELPQLGGSWLSVLFLAGLLLGFRNPAIQRLRYFVVGSLGVLVVVQSLGRTQLSTDSPELNSENLIVLLVPLVFIYGVSLFFMLLDQMNLIFRGLRPIIVALFGLVMVLPMLFTFLPPRSNPVNYPPYHPHAIQLVSGLMKEGELLMSDIPWAVAWYGKRQAVWLSRDWNESFFAINDYIKPVRGLYLSPLTMDAHFASQWLESGSQSWGRFLLSCFVLQNGVVPTSFPLREALPGFLPKQLFLCDQKRWGQAAPVFATPVPGETNAPASNATDVPK